MKRTAEDKETARDNTKETDTMHNHHDAIISWTSIASDAKMWQLLEDSFAQKIMNAVN